MALRALAALLIHAEECGAQAQLTAHTDIANGPQGLTEALSRGLPD